MDEIIALVAAHGLMVYALLFAYTFVKSGALPLFAAYAAQLGALDISMVAAASFSGTWLGDEVRFAVGRRWGSRLLERFPRLKPRVALALRLLERHRHWYILGYRFPKGARTIGALPLGITAMEWRSFAPLNFLAAALWAGLLVALGYGAGSLAETIWGPALQASGLVLLALFVAASWLLWRRASRRAVSDPA
ncbi:MAG: VTT domain-containing protein [Alphaproteobacteria bacterium]|nr:VTT domain-containing protein [Alphaproteobacteria bacterium]